MSGLLEVRGLTVELPTPVGWVRPVNEVSLRIDAGESLGLVGESGSILCDGRRSPNRRPAWHSFRTSFPAACVSPR
jgi:hypothetical protein